MENKLQKKMVATLRGVRHSGCNEKSCYYWIMSAIQISGNQPRTIVGKSIEFALLFCQICMAYFKLEY